MRYLTRRFVGFLLVMFWVLVSTASFAAGTVRLEASEIKEANGRWLFRMRITLPKAPVIRSQTMRLVMHKRVVYERAIVKRGQPPVLNRIPLTSATPNIVELDVDFADGSATIHASTNYAFPLRRDPNVEAGEYEVELIGSDGQRVGTMMRVILQGDNPVVDRTDVNFDNRSMERIGRDKPDAGSAPPPDPNAVPTPTAVRPIGVAPPMVPKDAYEPEENLKVRKSGCSCDVVRGGGGSYAGLGLAALLALALRRRASRA